MSIGKTALVVRLSARLGLSKASAETMIAETLIEIERAVRAGEDVTLHGLGSLRVRVQKPRAGTAPGGREYSEPAKMVLRFRPAAELAEAVGALPVPAE